MKLQIFVTTPLGVVTSLTQEVTQDEHDGLHDLLKRSDLTYFTFKDEMGDVVHLPENVVKNSIFQLRILK
ncbi:hypothetical protein SCRM01_189 [Synechococcus phage S-CRM01]|uniref:hypothetical protein n=1 Tax=Synechococcus phage S-CRM01 TaxID=1026955 RepID=UPI000209E40E|nr:hypothetical protein SCRM01_189 [Synechococcus phage S-CRM01]AEC53135.1 hypothetical protein SCRM01_189 [Synechococcus phage S-CRM01]